MEAYSIGETEYVVGYVLEKRSTDLRYTKHPEKISKFCQENGYSLIFCEQEVGIDKDICRPGLWRVTCALLCYECDPGQMPISYDVESWVQKAMMFCRCNQSRGVNGIVVASILSICTNPVSGSKYAIALAKAHKHLFVVDEGKCISCCNPAAKPFMGEEYRL